MVARKPESEKPEKMEPPGHRPRFFQVPMTEDGAMALVVVEAVQAVMGNPPGMAGATIHLRSGATVATTLEFAAVVALIEES